MKKEKLIEVCRSFSQTVQIEQFHPRSFFMSCKAEVPFDEVDSVAKELYTLCRLTVENDIEEYKKEKEEENTIDYDKIPHREFKVEKPTQKELDWMNDLKAKHALENPVFPKYKSTMKEPNGEATKVLIDKNNGPWENEPS